MAHYDCSNCGESYGIAYGYCEYCTPKSVLALQKKLDLARNKATEYFNKELSKLRDEYVNSEIAGIKAEYNKEFELHKPKR